MKAAIRVKPGSSRTKVGGCYQPTGAEPALVVAVNAPAQDGKANKAVIQSLAKALKVKKSEIEIVSGHTGRTKIVDYPAEASAIWTKLLKSEN